MITDARVLDPEFVPNDVVHRDAEINLISSELRPVTDGETPESIFIHGPTGTGKTCIAQYTLEKLEESVIDLNTQYVNCWEDHTRFNTLYRVLEGVGRTLDIHRQSTPTDVLLDRLHDYDGPQYVVILDEVDQLDTTDVLYELHRTPNLTLILIGNQEARFFSRMDDRLASRLHTATRIEFKPYTTDELIAILQDRIRMGLHPDAIHDGHLERIAMVARGDARIALGVLRNAARKAHRNGVGIIGDSHIEDAVPDAKAELKQKNISKLTTDQEILYEILSEHGELAPGELYEKYNARAENPKTKRMVRNYLDKLEHYNLVEAQGEHRGRTYHPIQNPE